MSRARLKPRVEAELETSGPLVRPPTREEFAAECEAVTSAVVRTLETNLWAKMEKATVALSAVADAKQANPGSVHYPSAAARFVPAYSFILAHANAGGNEDELTVSRQFLEFLLRCVLDQVDFDEQQYQACNPDVAMAIRERKMASGREHFIRTGYIEGRSGAVSVDEAWYLARNPDVAAAKRAGTFESAAAQYRLAGASEWRAPNPPAEGAIRIWKNVLQRR